MPEKAQPAITAAKGTIYFVKDSSGLKQGFDITIDNPGSPFDAEITLDWGANRHSCGRCAVGQGQTTMRVYVPDVREPAKMTFALAASKAKPLIVDHKPQRHWTVHLIQFAHHDLGYTDLPSNVLKEFLGFYDDVLRFCSETDSFPEESKFRYTIEQGWSLMHFLEHRPPEVREEMMRRIREGRIEVNAFVGNETTELLGPEEMVRMLYPVFALKRDHGIQIVSAEHNDIPGISWGVAAAMAGAGIKYFAPALPDYFRWGPQYHTFWDEQAVCPQSRPYAFHWEAPNGEKTLFWYGRQGAGGDINTSLSYVPEYLEKLEGTDYPYNILRYLVMGGFRDNAPPRVEFARSCRDWNARWAYPRLVQSLNSVFFPALEQQLGDVPTFRGELPGTDYSCAANCTAYPSSLNRVTHDQLLAAERFATVASELTPYSYPSETLDEAYHCALMNDEHAWGLAHPTGPGYEASIAQHCEFAYRAAALAHDVLTKAVNEIADHVARKDDGYYAVVFNPLNWRRTDVVAVPGKPMDPCTRHMKPILEAGPPNRLWSPVVSNRNLIEIPSDVIKAGLEITDVVTGEPVPYEIFEVADPQAPVPYAAYRYGMGQYNPMEKIEVRFTAHDVPALGYKLYRISPAGKHSFRSGVKVGKQTLENEFYKVELDLKTGAIRSILDKELDRELVDSSADQGANQMVLRSSVTAEVMTSGAATIEIGRTGPVSGSLIVRTQAPGCPQITQEVILYSGIKRIDIANRVLKDSTPLLETFFAFPFAYDKPGFKYEGPLSVIEPLVDQFPGSNTEYYSVQHWADVTDGKTGVTLTSVDAPMMQFGGMWPLYVSQAHHGFTPPNFDHPFHTAKDVKKGHIYSFVLLNNYRTNFSPTQVGDLLFRYSITSHPGGWEKSDACRFGYSASLPLISATVEGKCDAGLPASPTFCEIDQPNILLLALKRAEDGHGLIVRVLETKGRDTDVAVTLPFISIKAGFETNLVEEDQKVLVVAEHAVRISVRAWDSATIRLIS